MLFIFQRVSRKRICTAAFMSKMSDAARQSLAHSKSACAEIIWLQTSRLVFGTMLRFSRSIWLILMSLRMICSTCTPQGLHVFSTYSAIFALTSSRLISRSWSTYDERFATYSPQMVRMVTQVISDTLCTISLTMQVALKASTMRQKRVVSMSTLMLSLVQTSWLRMSTTFVLSQTVRMFYVKGLKQCRPGSRVSLNLPNSSMKPSVEVSILVQLQQQHPKTSPRQVIYFLQVSYFSAMLLNSIKLRFQQWNRLIREALVSQTKWINSHYIVMRVTGKNKLLKQHNLQDKSRKMKTVFLQIEDNFIKPAFPNALPNKCAQNSYRPSRKHFHNEQENRTPKRQPTTGRSSSIPIDLDCLKQIKVENTNKTTEPQQLPLENMCSHRLKFKMKRSLQHHRQNTSHSEVISSPKNLPKPEKKINSVIFAQFIDFEEDQRELAKSPNIYLRTSEGRKHKIDGYMYLRKIKAKCLSRQRNLSVSQSAQQPKEKRQRTLYTQSDHNAALKKKFYLTSYIQLAKQEAKKRKKEVDKSEEKSECRPWSASKSDQNLD